jgi:hypothetical protein
MEQKYDRSAEDLGNIVALEHVNVTVPDQQLATLFYVTGLGLTRDPYLMTGTKNMWVNPSSSICRATSRRWCAAMWGECCPIAWRCCGG